MQVLDRLVRHYLAQDMDTHCLTEIGWSVNCDFWAEVIWQGGCWSELLHLSVLLFYYFLRLYDKCWITSIREKNLSFWEGKNLSLVKNICEYLTKICWSVNCGIWAEVMWQGRSWSELLCLSILLFYYFMWLYDEY